MGLVGEALGGGPQHGRVLTFYVCVGNLSLPQALAGQAGLERRAEYEDDGVHAVRGRDGAYGGTALGLAVSAVHDRLSPGGAVVFQFRPRRRHRPARRPVRCRWRRR